MASLSQTTLTNLCNIREGLYARRSGLTARKEPIEKIQNVNRLIDEICEEIEKLENQISIADEAERLTHEQA